jgi:predicted MFS family arabinose efflux permease
VALPSIQGDLGTSSSAEQMMISAYAALYAVTLITGGRLVRHQASYAARRLA